MQFQQWYIPSKPLLIMISKETDVLSGKVFNTGLTSNLAFQIGSKINCKQLGYFISTETRAQSHHHPMIKPSHIAAMAKNQRPAAQKKGTFQNIRLLWSNANWIIFQKGKHSLCHLASDPVGDLRLIIASVSVKNLRHVNSKSHLDGKYCRIIYSHHFRTLWKIDAYKCWPAMLSKRCKHPLWSKFDIAYRHKSTTNL